MPEAHFVFTFLKNTKAKSPIWSVKPEKVVFRNEHVRGHVAESFLSFKS